MLRQVHAGKAARRGRELREWRVVEWSLQASGDTALDREELGVIGLARFEGVVVASLIM